MPVRIQPWPLPTIPGQATNEESGGGGNVTYIEFQNAKLTAKITSSSDNYNQNSKLFRTVNQDQYHQKLGGLIWEVTGAEVIDITGLTVTEEFTCNGVSISGMNGGSIPYGTAKGSLNDMTFVYSVGANLNRRAVKVDPKEAITDGQPTEYVEVVPGSVGYTITGTAKVKIRVLNSQGVVLQQHELTAEVTA